MNKAEEFIKENTRNCSQLHYNSACTLRHCITPDQAKDAVKIAREEIYEWLEKNAVNFVGLADGKHPAIGDTKAFYDTKSLIHYLRQAIEYE